MSKRSDQLFQYLVDITENVHAAAGLFEQSLADLSHPEAVAAKIKVHETKGDELTAELIKLLNATYITPLERDDFLQLAIKLDDIVDGLEACTVRFDLYQVQSSTPSMHELARTITEATAELVVAIAKLKTRKLPEIHQHCEKINQLEKAGDAVLRNAMRNLFQRTSDAVALIKYKELYEILESVIDQCEDVADVLESVIVKNS